MAYYRQDDVTQKLIYSIHVRCGRRNSSRWTVRSRCGIYGATKMRRSQALLSWSCNIHVKKRYINASTTARFICSPWQKNNNVQAFLSRSGIALSTWAFHKAEGLIFSVESNVLSAKAPSTEPKAHKRLRKFQKLVRYKPRTTNEARQPLLPPAPPFKTNHTHQHLLMLKSPPAPHQIHRRTLLRKQAVAVMPRGPHALLLACLSPLLYPASPAHDPSPSTASDLTFTIFP